MTLLNPTGFDLNRYEDKLEQQKIVYSKKLDQTIWMALPADTQQQLWKECRLGVRNIPSFQEHRQQLLSALAEAGWPVAEEELSLLEHEMALADSFLRWNHIYQPLLTDHPHTHPTTGIPELFVRREHDQTRSLPLLNRSHISFSAHRCL